MALTAAVVWYSIMTEIMIKIDIIHKSGDQLVRRNQIQYSNQPKEIYLIIESCYRDGQLAGESHFDYHSARVIPFQHHDFP